MTAQFVTVTEIAGQPSSVEQLDRISHRYHWAAEAATGKDVLEVACGAGQGLGVLKAVARSLVAGDISPEVLASAKAVYGDTVSLSIFGAETLPFPDASFDVVLIFEALYFVPDAAKFFAEAHRVLRPTGCLLIVTANKDLYDFTPSPYSSVYLGVVELETALRRAGFKSEFSGYIDVRTVSMRQRILRPVKAMVSKLNLMPKTMNGKELLKKLFFGKMALMPNDVSTVSFDYQPPLPISPTAPDMVHKVLYCRAEPIG